MFDQLMFYVLMAFFASLFVIMAVWAWVETGGADHMSGTRGSNDRYQENGWWRSSRRCFVTIRANWCARLLKRRGAS